MRGMDFFFCSKRCHQELSIGSENDYVCKQIYAMKLWWRKDNGDKDDEAIKAISRFSAMFMMFTMFTGQRKT